MNNDLNQNGYNPSANAEQNHSGCNPPANVEQNQGGYNPPPPNYNYVPPQNYGYNPPPKKPTNGMAIASLVLGIVGVVLSCCCCIGVSLICSVLAIIFAIISRSSSPDGRMNSMAVAGLIIGAVGAALSIVVILLYALGTLPEIQYNMNDFMNEFQDIPYGEFGDM